MAKEQKYGIKFPINVVSEDKTLFDLNKTRAEMIKSQIMHLIFTPKGQRLRMPNYGTDLIKYIFEPNDSDAWEAIKGEIRDSVSAWIDGVTLNDIQVMASESGNEIYVRIDYSVKDGNYEYKNSLAVEI